MEDAIHIIWTMLTSDNTYIDARLSIRAQPVAVIVDTFYEPTTRILQIRANESIARKIIRQWSERTQEHEVVPEEVATVGLANRAAFEHFKRQLDGRTVKCRGRLLESRGFDEVSGTKNEDVDDAEGTADYNQFVATTTPTLFDMRVPFGNEKIILSVGLKKQLFIIRNMVTNEAVQYVYSELKTFLGL
jgi:hypothetical protein